MLRICSATLIAVLLAAGVWQPARGATVVPRPSAGCQASVLQKGRPLERTITVDGKERTYLLDVPEGIVPGTPVPLLFDFHGFGHSAAGVWKVSGFKDLAAHAPFITVYPQGEDVQLMGRSDRGWQMLTVTDNRDLAFTRSLLDTLEQTYCIDRNRVYSTGFSNGAFFSNLLGCVMADRFAAVAPVSGGHITVPCIPTRPVPVIIFHGRQDPLIPLAEAHAERDAWVETDGCREHVSNGCERHSECRDGAEVRYCEVDGVHTWPPGATVQIWEFLMQHPMK